ncbi:MAG: hypothetical protein ACYCW6_11600 [Candidatus Xenobia bacterium]
MTLSLPAVEQLSVYTGMEMGPWRRPTGVLLELPPGAIDIWVAVHLLNFEEPWKLLVNAYNNGRPCGSTTLHWATPVDGDVTASGRLTFRQLEPGEVTLNVCLLTGSHIAIETVLLSRSLPVLSEVTVQSNQMCAPGTFPIRTPGAAPAPRSRMMAQP